MNSKQPVGKVKWIQSSQLGSRIDYASVILSGVVDVTNTDSYLSLCRSHKFKDIHAYSVYIYHKIQKIMFPQWNILMLTICWPLLVFKVTILISPNAKCNWNFLNMKYASINANIYNFFDRLLKHRSMFNCKYIYIRSVYVYWWTHMVCLLVWCLHKQEIGMLSICPLGEWFTKCVCWSWVFQIYYHWTIVNNLLFSFWFVYLIL